MTHHRNRSEGLNVGEGFPTSYSSFAVSSAETRRSSITHAASDAGPKASSVSMKRRTSGAPPATLNQTRLRGYQSRTTDAVSRFTFGDAGISTTKKGLQTLLQDYKKRWSFVMFFVAFSALVVFGLVLPVSRQASSLAGWPRSGRAAGQTRREVAYRSTRVKQPLATPPMEKPNRFVRWASNLFGSEPVSQPVYFSAGLGALSLPDYSTPAAQPTKVLSMTERPVSRRSMKQRVADAAGREDEHEHPSRAARRERASSLAAEDRLREAEMAKQRLIRRRVMERVAKAFKAGVSEEPADVERELVDNPEGEHILDTYEAAHPETVE